MRAPVLNFNHRLDENDGELAVISCNNETDDGKNCYAELLLVKDVKKDTQQIQGEDDVCINFYDERDIALEGANMHCLKCNGVIGIRRGTTIVFMSHKVVEILVQNVARVVAEYYASTQQPVPESFVMQKF